MKKKIVFLLCFLGIFFLTQGFSLHAYAAMTEDRFEYVIENNTVTIVRYKGTNKVVTVPERIQNLPVTKIGSFAFWYDPQEEGIRKAVERKVEQELSEQEKQPNQEIELAEDTDLYVNQITEIKLPSTLKSIDNMAFFSCGNITSIRIPEGVQTIEDYAFLKCSRLQTAQLPSTLTKLGNGAFEDCSNLKSIAIPSKINRIGYYTFCGCRSLSSVSLPVAIETIQSSAFERCSGLGNIALPSNLKKIMSDAFLGCTNLKSVKFSLGITLIGSHAFGFKEESSGAINKIAGFTMDCHADSAPHTYAVKNGISCKLTQHTNTTTTTKATLTASGKIKSKCSVCGYTASKTIYYPKTIAFAASSTPFTGGVTKPDLIVKDAKGNVIAANNYTVQNTTNCTRVGKHSVKITFTGNYSGTVSRSYTIVPKSVEITNLAAMVKGFNISWQKQTAETTGYQVQFSRSASFASPYVLKTYTSYKTVSAKIIGLKAKSKFYVRVRAYKTVSGVKYYSAWSQVKTFTTK